MQNGMTKNEFYKQQAPAKIRSGILTGVVCGYISAAVTLLAVLINPFMLLDFVLMLGLVLGVHLTKSRACATIIAVYFILSKILLSGFNLFGILFIVAYLYMAYNTYLLHTAWKEYQNMDGSGYPPQGQGYPPQGQGYPPQQGGYQPTYGQSTQPPLHPVNPTQPPSADPSADSHSPIDLNK